MLQRIENNFLTKMNELELLVHDNKIEVKAAIESLKFLREQINELIDELEMEYQTG